MVDRDSQIEIEAEYWKDFCAGEKNALAFIESGTNKAAVRWAAMEGIQQYPEDEAYYRGMFHACKGNLLRRLWNKIPTLPKKARSQ